MTTKPLYFAFVCHTRPIRFLGSTEVSKDPVCVIRALPSGLVTHAADEKSACARMAKLIDAHLVKSKDPFRWWSDRRADMSADDLAIWGRVFAKPPDMRQTSGFSYMTANCSDAVPA